MHLKISQRGRKNVTDAIKKKKNLPALRAMKLEFRCEVSWVNKVRFEDWCGSLVSSYSLLQAETVILDLGKKSFLPHEHELVLMFLSYKTIFFFLSAPLINHRYTIPSRNTRGLVFELCKSLISIFSLTYL